MPQIKVLPVDLRNKIAAGEVIERPASVVKELVENSIDAGSTEIRVDVLSGGKRLIRVSDNGTGMDREDALLCFERHATSKLLKEDDLFAIRTLGFRGEALPSIASVSKVRLTTGTRGSSSGVAMELHGGEIKEIKDSPSLGTSIEIRDLFFNTPARKKFLKTTNTELLHIIDTVTKAAIANHGIHFTLSAEKKETMLLPRASGLKERLIQIYGEDFLAGLIEVHAAAEDMDLKAFVSGSSNFRNSRSHQLIFVNLRPVKDQSISHALYHAYEGILPHEKHPVFFLFLSLDPERVDFNVHPAKREVRFADKEMIYRFVSTYSREAVRGDRAAFVEKFAESDEMHSPRPSPDMYPAAASTSSDSFVAEKIEFAYQPSLPFIYLGDTFIAVSGKGGLTLIDHHAAHERVLYEKFLRKTALPPHHLLFPQQVKLSPMEYRLILDNRDLLNEFGIEADDFGHHTIVVRAIPDLLEQADLRGILSDVASALADRLHPGKSMKEAIAAKIACHSSVRGREILTQEEFTRLLADLEASENPDQCPHGRPTRIFYTLDDLKKLFKRK